MALSLLNGCHWEEVVGERGEEEEGEGGSLKPHSNLKLTSAHSELDILLNYVEYSR